MVVTATTIIVDSSILNTSSYAGHECRISSSFHIGHGVYSDSEVSVGICSQAGIADTLIQDKAIGNDFIIGAGLVVLCDTPGKIIR